MRRQRPLETELPKQTQGTLGKLEIADTVRPPSATIGMAHVKSNPDTCYYVSGYINGWKTAVLLDAGSEKSLIHGEHPMLKAEKICPAEVKLVNTNH